MERGLLGDFQPQGVGYGNILMDEPVNYGAVDPAQVQAATEMGMLMMPSSGISEMLGYAPDPFSDENLPSAAELIEKGDFEGLGYQLLGVSGDVMYAVSPFTGGLLVLPATAAKGARASRIAAQTQKLPTVKPEKKYLPNPSKPKIKFEVGSKVDASGIGKSLEQSAELQDVKSIPMSAFDVESTASSSRLAKKIDTSKKIDPITVVQDKDGFRIIDGEKRVAAMKELGMTNIPAKIGIDLKNPPYKSTGDFKVNITKGSEAEKILKQDALQHGRDMLAGKVPMQDFGNQTGKDMPFSEYSAKTSVTTGLRNSLPFDPQANVGRQMKLIPYDITGAGYQIDEVTGIPLVNKTQMQGGVDFRLLGNEALKSEQSVVSGIVNEANRNEQGILGVISNMGGRSNDFSHHVTDTMLDIARQNASSVDPAIIKQYDDEVRALKGGDSFLGLLNPKLDEQLYSLDPEVRLSGDIRKNMSKIMDKATYRDAGLVPSMGAIRYAVTRPDLRYALRSPDDSLNPTGLGVVDIQPNAMRTDPSGNYPISHKTYLYGVHGEDAGGLLTPVPRITFFPDFYGQRTAYGSLPRANRRSAETSNVTNLLTQQIADNVNNYDEYYQRGLLGF